MRILMTVHRFWPSVGGTEILVEGLVETLAKRGHEVTVATSAEPGAPADQTRNGYRIRRFDVPQRRFLRTPDREYRAFLKRPDWDVIVVHGQRVWSTDYAYDIIRRSPTPIVLMYHGFYQHHMNAFRPPEWLYYHRVLGPSSKRRHIIAETEAEREELARFGVPLERVGVVRAFIDVAEFATPRAGFRAKYGIGQDEPLLLYVGGFYANKRVDDAIRIAARVGARLVVIGRDPSSEQRNLASCRALAGALGARVDFLGTIPRDDVVAAFYEASLFVLPSRFEGYGLVLLEAMAAGLPFVASRAGAGPELAALNAGVSASTWEDMAREARALLADPERRARMGAIGRQRAPEFTRERVVAEHEAFYERAVREQLAEHARGE